MFHSPFLRSNVMISDAGYSVRLKLPYALYYEEGDLRLDVTCDAVKPEIDVLHGTASAMRGGVLVHLTADEDKRVFENIQSALEWRGYNVHIVS